ncbi:hypothetical protein [Micromonospora chalcea]|uniref:hypothetical protein n=1 Tax=Micromonospora chalcea TaxID=1874 RepID=UPI003D74D1B7
MSTFEVEVISDPIGLVPNQGFDFSSPLLKESPNYDTQLVKPAILFADHVNLVSSRSTLHHFIGMHGWRSLNMPMRQMGAFLNLSIDRDPVTLDMLGLEVNGLADSEEAKRIKDAIAGCQTNEEFNLVMSDVADPFFERYEQQLDDLTRAFSALWVARHEMLVAPELIPAIDRDVLTVQGWVEDLPPQARIFVANEDFLEESFAGMLERLQDPQKLALMDAALPSSSEEVNSFTEAPASPAFLGNAIISRIPGLSDLPMMEVLDLRDDLKAYLPHFRSEIVQLSQDVAQVSSRRDLVAEVDRRWHRDIAPAMEEIRREVAAARYPKRLLDAVTSDPATIASGAGALTIAAGGLAVGLSALLPAVAAAAYPFLKAKALRDQGLAKAQTNKLFFLYELHNRVSAP